MSSDEVVEDISLNMWKIDDFTKFCGTRKPLNKEEVMTLMNSGVVGIISLLDDSENIELYNSISGLHVLHVPIAGGTSPTNEQIENIRTFYDSLNLPLLTDVNSSQLHSPSIAIHCTNGRRRTGTVIGCLYIMFAVDEVIRKQKNKDGDDNNNPIVTSTTDDNNDTTSVVATDSIQTDDANIIYTEMITKLMLAKPDCDLREGQLTFMKDYAVYSLTNPRII